MSSAGIKAGRAFVEIHANDDEFQRRIRRVQIAMLKTQKRFQTVGGIMSGMGTRSAKVGTGMMAMGGAAVAGFTPAVMQAAEFQKQMNMVSTMVDDEAAHMADFEKGIKRMSITYGESTSTLAEGLYGILSAGVAAEGALEVLEVATKAATAGMTDTGSAAKAITVILNSYGLAADRAGDVSDLLFSIVKRGVTTFPELANGIGTVASVAAAAEVPLDQLGAMIATLTKGGLSTDQAMTALNAVISSFLKPVPKAVAYAKELGIEMSAAALKSEGLLAIFQKLEGMDPESIAKLFPNTRALKGVLPAIKNLDGFAQDIDVMANRAGATDEAFQKMARGMDQLGRSAKQAGIQLLVALGSAVEGPIRDFVPKILSMVKVITTWAQANQSTIRVILAVVAAVSALGAVMAVVGVGAIAIGAAISGIGAIIGAAAVAIKVLAVGFGLLLSAIPLAIFVAATTAVLYFSGAFGKLWQMMQPVVNYAKSELLPVFKVIGKAIAAGDLKAAWKIFGALATRELTRVKEFFFAWLASLRDRIYNIKMYGPLIKGIVTAATVTARNIGKMIGWVVKVGAAYGAVVGIISSRLLPVAKVLWTFISKTVSAVWKGLSDLIGLITNIVDTVIRALSMIAGKVLEILSYFTAFKQTLRDWAEVLGEVSRSGNKRGSNALKAASDEFEKSSDKLKKYIKEFEDKQGSGNGTAPEPASNQQAQRNTERQRPDNGYTGSGRHGFDKTEMRRREIEALGAIIFGEDLVKLREEEVNLAEQAARERMDAYERERQSAKDAADQQLAVLEKQKALIDEQSDAYGKIKLKIAFEQDAFKAYQQDYEKRMTALLDQRDRATSPSEKSDIRGQIDALQKERSKRKFQYEDLLEKLQSKLPEQSMTEMFARIKESADRILKERDQKIDRVNQDEEAFKRDQEALKKSEREREQEEARRRAESQQDFKRAQEIKSLALQAKAARQSGNDPEANKLEARKQLMQSIQNEANQMRRAKQLFTGDELTDAITRIVANGEKERKLIARASSAPEITRKAIGSLNSVALTRNFGKGSGPQERMAKLLAEANKMEFDLLQAMNKAVGILHNMEGY